MAKLAQSPQESVSEHERNPQHDLATAADE